MSPDARVSEVVLKAGADVRIGLRPESRQGVVEVLNALLADEYVLYTKTRNYHWNVTGPQFNDLHRFFETQYEQLDAIIDDVAERARALGGWAVGTLREFVDSARLTEHPASYPEAGEMLRDLLSDHEAVVRRLREDADVVLETYGDAGTNDFLIGLMEAHEKMAWMLRAFVTQG